MILKTSCLEYSVLNDEYLSRISTGFKNFDIYSIFSEQCSTNIIKYNAFSAKKAFDILGMKFLTESGQQFNNT